MAAPQVEIAVSNMDLYPIMPGQASWGSNVEQLESYLDYTGFQDFEVHPTTKLHNRVVRSATDNAYISTVIGSLHQTFNSGKGLIGAAGFVSGLAKTDESYERMLNMEQGLEPMPLVVYPSKTLESAISVQGVPKRSPLVVQPAPEVYRDYEAFSDEVLIAKMAELSIRGLCPDTVHSRRKAEDGFIGPRADEVWADQFASGRVYQMHVAADRVDMAGRDKDMAETSHNEFEAFIASWQAARDTEMGDMIVTAVQAWQKPADLGRNVLRMVVEIPPVPREARRRKAQHLAFADNLAQLVEFAGAAPIMRSQR